MFLIGGKKWTEDELDFLRLAVEDKESNLQDIAEFLGRTPIAVKIKVYRLMRGTSKGGLIWRHWSTEEKEKLRQLYPTVPMESLCEIFKRDKTSIICQASRLGVHKNNCIFRNEAEIRKLANQGLTYREIAESIGDTTKNLRDYTYRYGIKVRHEPRSKDHPWIKDREIMDAQNKRWRKEHLKETDE